MTLRDLIDELETLAEEHGDDVVYLGEGQHLVARYATVARSKTSAGSTALTD